MITISNDKFVDLVLLSLEQDGVALNNLITEEEIKEAKEAVEFFLKVLGK